MENRFILIAIIGNFLLVTGNAGKIKRLPNLECYPRPAVFQTSLHFYPYFVNLHRCNGSKGTLPPSKFRCVPKTTNNFTIFLKTGENPQPFTLKNHTECKTECTISRDSCKYPNVYDPVKCSCSCHHVSPPSDLGSCGPNRTWNSASCGCQCKNRHSCSKENKFIFDEETCSCKCNPDRRKLCESINSIFVSKNCGCRKPPKLLSNINNASVFQTGSFVGSTAFWVYILIGEFVLLLICFDAILYFKHMGAIHSITRKCRTKPFNVNEDEVEGDTKGQTLKVNFSAMSDASFSSLQDTSRTDFPSKTSKARRL